MTILNQVTVKIPGEFKELFNPYWRNIIFYGGRGSTKSHSVARSLIIRGRQKKYRILCARELQNSIEESSFQLLKDIIDLYGFNDYTYTNNEIVNKITGTTILFKGLKKGHTQSVKSLEGIDICWVEEAQSVTSESLEILSPTVRNKGSQLIFTFNRMTDLDPVYVKYVMNPPARTFSKLINFDVAVKCGMFSKELQEEMEYDREHRPELFEHKWLGLPMSQSDESIISRTETLAAMNRKISDDGAIIIGADIARMGNDRIVFWKRKGLKTIGFEVHNKKKIPKTCDLLERFAKYDKEVQIKVDDTGVGGGVTDEMENRGYNVIPINFGAMPQDKDKYPNLISEAWFNLSDIIKDIELPMNDDLLMELSTRQWFQDSKGKRRVESKEQYKKRGFRSPDLADACIICYYNNEMALDEDDVDIL